MGGSDVRGSPEGPWPTPQVQETHRLGALQTPAGRRPRPHVFAAPRGSTALPRLGYFCACPMGMHFFMPQVGPRWTKL